eukprot:gene7607-10358_t
MAFWKPGTSKPSATSKVTNAEANTVAPSSSTTSITLSKSIMGMKFMKRKEQIESEQQNESERIKRLRLDNWNNIETQENGDCKMMVDEPTPSSIIYIIDEENDLSLYPGRRSFGGFNKHVEKKYQLFLDELRYTKAKEKVSKNSVDDEEMLKRYENLIGLPRGPNQGQRPASDRRDTNNNNHDYNNNHNKFNNYSNIEGNEVKMTFTSSHNNNNNKNNNNNYSKNNNKKNKNKSHNNHENNRIKS